MAGVNTTLGGGKRREGGTAWRRRGGLLKALTRALLVFLVVVGPVPCSALVVARCPPKDTSGSVVVVSNEYCLCRRKEIRSGILINITCNFLDKEEVALTEALYPFRMTRAVSVYVRVSNAISVRVTEGFLGAWLGVPSAGLDLWNIGRVTLAPAPLVAPAYHSFRTSAGIGIVGCRVSELPQKLLRNKYMLRYLVVEDSTVEVVEGTVSTAGIVALSTVRHPTFNGLILSNVTISNLAPSSFNLAYKKVSEEDSNHKVELRRCHLGRVGTGALTVAGDIAVTIKGNVFTNLASQAFKINVMSDLKFEENVAVRADMRSLEEIVCHNLTSLEKNTVHLSNVPPIIVNATNSIIPFHASCGIPQVFTVVSPTQPLVRKIASTSTWVLLTLLLVLVVGAMVLAVKQWRHNNMRREFTHNNSFLFHNGLKTQQSRQQQHTSRREEVAMMDDVSGEGVSNPLYEDMEYKSSL
ncbi:hypothetical protein Pcinc_027332 [Petrolisthes cinctipes]|uniref:Uncharacterized protein n=1 Tax=Petrolisthes cinctipes TaxID=88211 RepID=A0AAE1F5H9_PETCI|nr:hypothetical protein Pcinc_027332 [Petrolisthes cinctipes]